MNTLVPARSVAQPCVHRVTARILLAAAALALSACGKQPPAPQAPQPPEVGVLQVEARACAYTGEGQLFAARLYEGQTTNFRSDGGGFAPVFVTPT